MADANANPSLDATNSNADPVAPADSAAPAADQKAPEPSKDPDPSDSAQKKSATLTMTVADQNGAKTFFKVRTTTPFSKVMKAYAKRKGVEVTSLRFSFEGQRITDTDTPVGLDMNDTDQIDVFQEQTGGVW